MKLRKLYTNSYARLVYALLIVGGLVFAIAADMQW